MSPAARTWLFVALTLGYLVSAHFALARQSAAIGAVSTAVLVLLVLTSIKGPGRTLLRLAVALGGALLVAVVARGAPPVPLMLPPVAIPASIAWMFGRTLFKGTPLVERLARGFHAPAVPAPEIIAYARRVTWAWTLLLAVVALVNGFLLMNVVPGGLIALMGYTPRWPVKAEVFHWFGNIGTYLLIGGMFVVEFTVRVWKFPDYRFRNPLEFIREARKRMPNIAAAIRNG